MIDCVLHWALSSLFALSASTSGDRAVAQRTTRDAVVDARFKGTEGAFAAGVKTYRTLTAAVENAPGNAGKPYTIYIKDGRYYEKLTISKPNIAFVGESRDRTILTYDAFSGVKTPDGTNLGTWKCATLIIQAPDFHAENMTIENGYDFPANDAKEANDPTKTSAPQAVAAMTDQGSDRAFFRNVRFTGYQDTLFVFSGRSYFTKCIISGHVDFIFGAGQVIFEDDDIFTRARRPLMKPPIGYITAPSTQISQRYGLVFIHCRLLKESPAVPVHSSPLGRPWHPTTNFPDGRYADPNAIGMSVFIRCFMDDYITEAGWDQMHGTGRNPGEQVFFKPEDARFFEYRSSGPGAYKNASRRQLSETEVREYTIEKVLNGWKPAR